MEKVQCTREEAIEHVGGFVNALGMIVSTYLEAIDPSESPEAMEYVRSVLRAADDLMLTTIKQRNNEEMRARLDASNDEAIAALIAKHNEETTKH